MAAHNLYNETDLFNKVALGDEKAFKTIFDSYWPQVYGTSLHLTKKPELARDLSQEVDGVMLSDSVYISQLNQRATEKMAENKETRTFEGEVETTIMFIFGTDFFMGDVVQITNEYEIEARARVGELIIAQNTEGFSMVPTFSIVE